VYIQGSNALIKQKCIKSKNDFLNGNMDIEYRASEIYIYISLSKSSRETILILRVVNKW